jgi:hypothetical protein
MAFPLDSTYGVWLVSLFLGPLLYSMGLLQTWIYFAGRPADLASIKWIVDSNFASTEDFVQPTAQQVLAVLCDRSIPGVYISDMFCLQAVGDDRSDLFLPFVVLSFVFVTCESI